MVTSASAPPLRRNIHRPAFHSKNILHRNPYEPSSRRSAHLKTSFNKILPGDFPPSSLINHSSTFLARSLSILIDNAIPTLAVDKSFFIRLVKQAESVFF